MTYYVNMFDVDGDLTESVNRAESIILKSPVDFGMVAVFMLTGNGETWRLLSTGSVQIEIIISAVLDSLDITHNPSRLTIDTDAMSDLVNQLCDVGH